MNIRFHRQCLKEIARAPHPVQVRFDERLAMFKKNAKHTQLRIHQLKGEWRGCWSMNVTGDYRAIFEWEDATTVVFLAFGTHSELYS